jgi:glycosyltransferase involved in cell wall biosynthesis
MTLPIAIDYSAAVTQGGGIGRYTRELVTALARQDTQTQYVLFSAKPSSDLPPLPGSNFRGVSTRLSTDWLARLWHRARLPLSIELWTGPIRLLHSPDFTLPPVNRGVPTLLTVHDLSFVRTPETATAGLRAYLNSAVPRSVRRADRILADSEATRQDLIELYQTPPDKIRVLYSGVDHRFQPVRTEKTLDAVRKKYQLGSGPFILSVGTIQPRKNYERLVEAFRRLDNADFKLVIVGGKGWLDHPLYKLIEKLGMEESVQFLGFVADDDLPALYSAAHVFAFPSLYEGFGLPALEAMACGTPVLTSNISSLPEVAGGVAISVEPTDVDAIAEGLGKLIEDTGLRKKLIQQGITRATLFNWNKAAGELREHYQDLLA